MQTTSNDQVNCTQLCSLHTRTGVQSCSYAPTSERMQHYAPNFQPPNYANNYAGIIRQCLSTRQMASDGHRWRMFLEQATRLSLLLLHSSKLHYSCPPMQEESFRVRTLKHRSCCMNTGNRFYSSLLPSAELSCACCVLSSESGHALRLGWLKADTCTSFAVPLLKAGSPGIPGLEGGNGLV